MSKKCMPAIAPCIAATLLLFAASATNAAVISFGNSPINPLSGAKTEGLFTYEVISGIRWALVNTYGNPASVLSTGASGAPKVGDRIDVYLTGGGNFSFDAFDYAGFANSLTDTVNFIGELEGLEVKSLSGVSSNSASFQNAAGFGGPIDRLRIEIAAFGNTDLGIDNIRLTDLRVSVPIPAPLVLVCMALIGLGWSRSRFRP